MPYASADFIAYFFVFGAVHLISLRSLHKSTHQLRFVVAFMLCVQCDWMQSTISWNKSSKTFCCIHKFSQPWSPIAVFIVLHCEFISFLSFKLIFHYPRFSPRCLRNFQMHCASNEKQPQQTVHNNENRVFPFSLCDVCVYVCRQWCIHHTCISI